MQLPIPYRQIKNGVLSAGDMFIILIIHCYFLSALQASVHLRLAEQTLLTLTGYLDWVKFAVLYSQNCIILQMLCLLLEEDALKIRAADCLLMIVSRKVSIRFWETSCPPTPSLNQHEHKILGMGGVGGFWNCPPSLLPFKPMLTLTSHLGQNVRLGEEYKCRSI